ncbi:MAG: S-methyl-5-thioribose-1-phosphate isomerase [bacterium]|nr:S-methyl-5-thioribose-1-phosphate isomerase [bacterium]
MKIDGVAWRSIQVADDARTVIIIDQTCLPHRFVTTTLTTLDDAAHAIRTMQVRGAPLIGATAAYGMALAMRRDASDQAMNEAARTLLDTRPTAVNLRWAVERVLARLTPLDRNAREDEAYALAAEICDEDAAICEAIGEHGLAILKGHHEETGRPVQVMTHCNAGWLATVDWGTALAPVYKAHDAGVPVHVWVSETRPRNQGASLTAWELARHGVPHTLVVDNAAGHLMRTGRVDMTITGADRVTASGDVCNKIGTYLKALAAHRHGLPFYAALPSPTIDWRLMDGDAIPIEERGGGEVTTVTGCAADGTIGPVAIAPETTMPENPAFDVTPAELVTGLITERGLCDASAGSLAGLFTDQA